MTFLFDFLLVLWIHFALMTALVLPWKFSVTFLKRCLCENWRAKFNITCLTHSSVSNLHHFWKSWILTCVSTTATNVFSNIHKHQCTWYAAVRLFKYTNLCLVCFIPNKLENIYMQLSVKLSPWIRIVKSLAGSFMVIPVQLVPMQLFLQSGGNLSEVWVTAERRPAVQMVLKQQEAAGATWDFLIPPQESSKSSELLFLNSNSALNVFTYKVLHASKFMMLLLAE